MWKQEASKAAATITRQGLAVAHIWGSGVGKMCWHSGCVCCKWSKWDFPHGSVVGMKEREESGVELRVVKNKKFFNSLFISIKFNSLC